MNAKLKTLKRGQTFFGAGIQWLVLGHTNSSQGLPIVTHIVSTGIVERRAFDEKNRNDLGVSTLLAYLNGEFLERLEDAFGEGASRTTGTSRRRWACSPRRNTGSTATSSRPSATKAGGGWRRRTPPSGQATPPSSAA